MGNESEKEETKAKTDGTQNIVNVTNTRIDESIFQSVQIPKGNVSLKELSFEFKKRILAIQNEFLKLGLLKNVSPVNFSELFPDPPAKILVVGDTGVGKSSFLSLLMQKFLNIDCFLCPNDSSESFTPCLWMVRYGDKNRLYLEDCDGVVVEKDNFNINNCNEELYEFCRTLREEFNKLDGIKRSKSEVDAKKKLLGRRVILEICNPKLEDYIFIDTPGLNEKSNVSEHVRNEYITANVICYVTKSDRADGLKENQVAEVSTILRGIKKEAKLIFVGSHLDSLFNDINSTRTKVLEESVGMQKIETFKARFCKKLEDLVFSKERRFSGWNVDKIKKKFPLFVCSAGESKHFVYKKIYDGYMDTLSKDILTYLSSLFLVKPAKETLDYFFNQINEYHLENVIRNVSRLKRNKDLMEKLLKKYNEKKKSALENLGKKISTLFGDRKKFEKYVVEPYIGSKWSAQDVSKILLDRFSQFLKDEVSNLLNDVVKEINKDGDSEVEDVDYKFGKSDIDGLYSKFSAAANTVATLVPLLSGFKGFDGLSSIGNRLKNLGEKNVYDGYSYIPYMTDHHLVNRGKVFIQLGEVLGYVGPQISILMNVFNIASLLVNSGHAPDKSKIFDAIWENFQKTQGEEKEKILVLCEITTEKAIKKCKCKLNEEFENAKVKLSEEEKRKREGKLMTAMKFELSLFDLHFRLLKYKNFSWKTDGGSKDVISGGNFGLVKAGIFEGKEVAVKEVKRCGFSSGHLLREIRWMNMVRMEKENESVPLIGCFKGSYADPNDSNIEFSIIMERFPCSLSDFVYLDGKSFFEKFQRLKILPPDLKVRLMLDIAKGLRFFHRNKIKHRDLKINNVLMCHGLKSCKICDFGFTKSAAQSDPRSFMGTPEIMDLNIMMKRLGGRCISNEEWFYGDVYSLGVIMAQIWNENAQIFTENFKKIRNKVIYAIMGGNPVDDMRIKKMTLDLDNLKKKEGFLKIPKKGQIGHTEVWKLIQQCVMEKMEIEKVVQELEKLNNSPNILLPAKVQEAEIPEDFFLDL